MQYSVHVSCRHIFRQVSVVKQTHKLEQTSLSQCSALFIFCLIFIYEISEISPTCFRGLVTPCTITPDSTRLTMLNCESAPRMSSFESITGDNGTFDYYAQGLGRAYGEILIKYDCISHRPHRRMVDFTKSMRSALAEERGHNVNSFDGRNIQ